MLFDAFCGPSSLSEFYEWPHALLCLRTKTSHNSVVFFCEFLQGNKRVFISHFGQGVSAPETHVLRTVIETPSVKGGARSFSVIAVSKRF